MAQKEKATPKTPASHHCYVVEGQGDSAHWTRVGAAWSHQDGKGFNVILTALPTTGRLVIRERNEGGRK